MMELRERDSCVQKTDRLVREKATGRTWRRSRGGRGLLGVSAARKTWRCLVLLPVLCRMMMTAAVVSSAREVKKPLRFRPDGTFKILQVSDMHLGNGASNQCADINRLLFGKCSDLNTTWFVSRLIAYEDPDLIVFSGDNIDWSSTDAIASMKLGFGAAIESGKPWAAILGNHDEEADLDRLGLMSYIVGMPFSYSKLNPSCVVAKDCDPVKGQFIVNGRSVSRDFRSCVSNIKPSANVTKNDGDGDDDSILFQCNVDDATIIMGGVNGLPIVEGWGNYHLEIKGPEGSAVDNNTELVLYLLDTGDRSKLGNRVDGYDWVRSGQQLWLKSMAHKFQVQSAGKGDVPPALAYFHIPVPEYKQVAHMSTISGTWQEDVCSPDVNSGFFTAMLEAGHIKAGFVGHDHINDFCGTLHGLRLCYAGGAGYHGYGKLGWDRRARVVQAVMSDDEGKRMGVNPAGDQSMSAGKPKVRQVWTWKRLDDGYGKKRMTEKDRELLWEFGRPTEDSKFPVFFLPCMVYQIATGIFTIVFLYLLIGKLCVKYRNRRNRNKEGGYVLASTLSDNNMGDVLPQWRGSGCTARPDAEGGS